MADQHDYTVEELVLNSSFRNWVTESDLSDDQYWLTWIGTDALRSKKADEARWLIGILKEKDFMNLSEEEIRLDIAVLMDRIKNKRNLNTVFQVSYVWKYIAAAVLVIGGILFYNLPRSSEVKTEMLSEKNIEVLQYYNSTAHPLTITLPDSSIMTLSPASKASYANGEEDERRVELTGEAFFDVRKNHHRPFIVLSNKLITKVLGTRFKVNSSNESGLVEVEVMSGKVSVFRKKDWEMSKKSVQTVASGVVLTANQKVDFKVIDGTFRKKLIDIPGKIEQVNIEDFEFVQTPVAEVFTRIQHIYGVEIVFDSVLVADCRLNASLADENMYEKIRLICQSIGATFQEVDARIIINAQKGCD